MKIDGTLEGAPTFGDEVIARIAHTLGLGRIGCRGRCCRSRLQCPLGDIKFGAGRAAGELLDRAAVEVARREIHRGEGAAGVQPVVDQADALEELRPVDVGDQPHAGDDVAHGDIRGAQPLLSVLHHAVDRRALMVQPLLQPAERRRRSRILVAQPLHQLRGEDFRQRLRGAGQDVGVERGAGFAQGQKPVSQRVGLVPQVAPSGDLVGQPTQILDEDDAQRDGNGPQFADRQRLDTLIGDDEAAQDLRVEVTVGVGDERPGQPEHPRIAGKRSVCQFRQLAIIAGRQIIPDLPDLFFDEMVIVQQPFRRRNHAMTAFHLGRRRAIGGEQHGGIVVQAGAKREDVRRLQRDRLRGRKALGMLLQSLDTEEFFPDGRGIVPERRVARCTVPAWQGTKQPVMRDRAHKNFHGGGSSQVVDAPRARRMR